MNRTSVGLFVLLSLLSACSQEKTEGTSESPVVGSVITDPNSAIEMVYTPAGIPSTTNGRPRAIP